MTSPSALHSKATPNWGTPQLVIQKSRELLGGEIILDPATSEGFNREVGARHIWTQETNGLAQSWYFGNGTTVFLNHPGGLTREFWRKLMEEMALGHVAKAVWIGFSVEQLCQLADESPSPLDFSTCILRKRLSFIRDDGFKGSPSHGNYITAIGCDHAEFERLFSDLGKITRGDLAT